MTTSPDIFTLLADYNSRANRALGDVLAPHEPLVLQPGTTWYGSLLDLLNHVMLADAAWLRRVPGGTGYLPASLQDSSLAVRGPITAHLAQWNALRRETDAGIEAFCAAQSAERIAAGVTYRNTRGSEFTQPLWQILLHLFNHQTHHRGQIAAVLDAAGIENDYSNLIWYLRGAPDSTTPRS